MVMLVSVKTRVRATSEAVVGDAETQHQRHWACPFASYAHRRKKKSTFSRGQHPANTQLATMTRGHTITRGHTASDC